MLKISLRENKTANAKSKYHSHSENEGSITLDELINEMAGNNTTLTKADIAGAMNVYKEVVLRYVQLGYKVYSPLGQVYISAKGTSNDKLAAFEPQLSSNDHDLNMRITVDSSVAKTIIAGTKTERVSGSYKMIPEIEEVRTVDGVPISQVKAGDALRIIGCAFDEKKALESLLLAKEKNLRTTLYAERKPSALFLGIAQRMENAHLLVCPESIDEARQCAAFPEKGKRYVSKAAQRKDETELLGKFVSLESLSEMNRLLVFAIAEWLSLKEMQSLTGRGERYIQPCLQRLKKRFNVLERRELFTALIKWISLDAGASHTG